MFRERPKNILFAGTLIFVLAAMVGVGYSDDTGQQNLKQLQEEIEHSLVAPCCWNMTVDQHDSPASRKVRTQIAEFLEQGKTKEEILDYFSSPAQYGERILATPSQKTLLGKLAYWLIPAALLFGLVVAAKTISRLVKKPKTRRKADQKIDEKAHPSSEWDKRFENELRDFDA